MLRRLYLAVAHLSVGKPHVFSAGREPGMRVFRHEGVHIRGGGVEYRVVFFVVAEAVAVEDYEKCFFAVIFYLLSLYMVVSLYGSPACRRNGRVLKMECKITSNGSNGKGNGGEKPSRGVSLTRAGLRSSDWWLRPFMRALNGRWWFIR